jgi:hypothetical protein
MKAILNRLSIILAFFALVSCFDDPGTDILWGSEAYFELDRAGQPNPTVNNTFERLNNGTKYPFSAKVNLMGRPQSKDVVVNYTITGTAVEGVHYNKLSAGTSLTIPSGSNSATINFEHLSDNLNSGETWTLIITLTGGDLPLSKYIVVTHNLRITCSFNRANFVGNYNTLEPGYGTYTNVATADGSNANAIRVDNFWDFGGNVQYIFNPANNTLSLPTQDVVMGGVTYVVAQNGTATYDACTYGFTVPYKVNRKSDGASFDTNVHTFTKQ